MASGAGTSDKLATRPNAAVLAGLDAVHARRAAGRSARAAYARGAPSPSWRQSNSALNNAAVRKIVERSRGHGGRDVRSALVNTPVRGAGRDGAWIPGQAAPASMKLGKRRVPGGRIIGGLAQRR